LRGLLKKNGKLYGVPFMWGTNLLMYDSQAVQPGPDSWSALFDPAQVRKYAGRIIMRDTPLTIGDAALYLKAANAKLKITDPFELTLKQLDAAAALLKAQHHSVKSYWSRSADVVNAFASGASVLGQVWPYHVDVLKRAGRLVTGVTPKEGVTGWVDSWMIGAHAPHPSCMYQWVNYMSSQDVQQQVAEWNGVAPANPAACARDLLKVDFCAAYHVDDRTYIDKVMFAHTPDRDCGGGRRDCTDYADWTRAWNGAVSGPAPRRARPTAPRAGGTGKREPRRPPSAGAPTSSSPYRLVPSGTITAVMCSGTRGPDRAGAQSAHANTPEPPGRQPTRTRGRGHFLWQATHESPFCCAALSALGSNVNSSVRLICSSSRGGADITDFLYRRPKVSSG
jgi:ABC-type Fe3+ transport system substrate-binding protein